MTSSLELVLRVGEHELPVVEMKGREAISELFEFSLDVAWREAGPLPAELAPAHQASLVMTAGGEAIRAIHGMVATVERRFAAGTSVATHHVRLVPRAWRAALVTTQQVLMASSVPEVLCHKLEKLGLGDSDVGLSLLSSYEPREFIVQYQERDIDFIGRIAEHVGISYYFDHEGGFDRLIFTDYNAGFATDAGCAKIALASRADEPDTVLSLAASSHLARRLYVVYDYNYRTPDIILKATELVDGGAAGGILEYGCHVKTMEQAQAIARIRAEELTCRRELYRGESNIARLRAGLLTTLEASGELPDTRLLVTVVEHRVQRVDGRGTLRYSNGFDAVRSDLTFRPERRSPRPSIHGVVTGIVQAIDGGTAGKVAHIDEHGRYYIKFHFDAGLGSEQAIRSRPVRMAQPFAGSGDGMHFPLKPGVEVAVAFVNGDPDRPIIVGALPNHSKPSVVTAGSSHSNRLQTDSGITIQFGKPT